MLCCGLQPAWAQVATDYNPDKNPDNDTIPTCGAANDWLWMMDKDPDLANQFQKMEQQLQQSLDEAKDTHGYNDQDNPQINNPQPTYYIPVVFHILEPHLPAGPQNTLVSMTITYAQIQQQLDVLNQDFSATNPDLALIRGTPYANLVGNAHIQFCLAVRDAAGNRTTGIERTAARQSSYWLLLGDTDDTNSPTYRPNDPAYPNQNRNPRFEAPAQPLYPTDKYLNIWVCNADMQEPGGPQNGVSAFPSPRVRNLGNDGVAINIRAFGVYSTTRPTFNYTTMGRTLTHEVGHWFNLRHIWGDDASRCVSNNGGGSDDGVRDTPDQAGPNGYYSPVPSQLPVSVCPFDPNWFGGVYSCGNQSQGGDMYMNYMDYTCERCRYMFSQEQVDRMLMSAQLFRPNIINPLNTLATAPNQVTIVSNLTGTAICPNDMTDYRFHAELSGGCGRNGVVTYQWSVSPMGWTITDPTAEYPGIIPDGSTSTTISLTVTYTIGNNPPVTLSASTYIAVGIPAPTFFIDIPNAVSIDISPGASGFFAATPVPGATAYTWTLPPGFTGTTSAGTFNGPVITSSGPIIQLTAPQVSGLAMVTYPLSVTVTVGGCVSPAATLNFHLLPVEAVITTSPVIPITSGEYNVCSNLVLTATANLTTCTQGSNLGFVWSIDPISYPAGHHRAEILSGATANTCQFTTGNSIYAAPHTVTLRVSFTNSVSGPQTASFTFRPGIGLPGEYCFDIIDDTNPRPTGPPTLYPNPATGQVIVEKMVGGIRLYNSQGRQVSQMAATPDAPTTLNIHGLPAGLYQVVGQDATGQPVRLQLQVQP